MQTKAFEIQLLDLERYKMPQLLDFEYSYQAMKRMLCEYTTAYRKKRSKATGKRCTRGGANANHRDLCKAILRILPVGMEAIRKERPGVFKKCLKEGKYAIITNSVALQKSMAQRVDEDDTEENDLVSRASVFNYLKLLEDAGIIVERKTVKSLEGTGKPATLLYINRKAIATYNLHDEPHLEQHPEQREKAPSDSDSAILVQSLDNYKENIRINNSINNSSEAVEKVQPIGCDTKIEDEKVRSKGVKSQFVRNMTQADLLWQMACQQLYPGQRFNMHIKEQALEMLRGHLAAAQAFVEMLRQSAIKEFTSSEKYLQADEKKKHWLLYGWFLKKILPAPLRNEEKTAFEIVCEALRIRKVAADTSGSQTYFPLVFFEANYGLKKYIGMAQDDLAKVSVYGLHRKSEHLRVKAQLRSWISAFAHIYLNHGINHAVAQADHYAEKASELLNDASSIAQSTKDQYLKYFKTQIISILENV